MQGYTLADLSIVQSDDIRLIGALQLGRTVRVKDLKTHTQFNGKIGTCLQWLERGRWRIELTSEPGRFLAVLPQNLEEIESPGVEGVHEEVAVSAEVRDVKKPDARTVICTT